MSMNLELSNRLISEAFAHAVRNRYRPMAVVVLDPGGHIVSAQRQDGASMLRIDIAAGKAWAALAMGASTRVLTERAAAFPVFYGALATTSGGKFIPQTGAVLLYADGEVIGSIGASGGTGDEDEEICIKTAQLLGLTTE